MRKIHIMDEEDSYVSYCKLSIHGYNYMDYVTLGAYKQIIYKSPSWEHFARTSGIFCANCLKKVDK